MIALSAPFTPDANTEKHLFIKEHIYFITRNDMLNNEISDEIHKVTSKPPLSKFGILPKFELISHDAFNETFKFFNSNLWLYSDGIVHRHSRAISFQEYMDLIAERKEKYLDEIPPILSNINVFFNNSSTISKQGVLF